MVKIIVIGEGGGGGEGGRWTIPTHNMITRSQEYDIIFLSFECKVLQVSSCLKLLTYTGCLKKASDC